MDNLNSSQKYQFTPEQMKTLKEKDLTKKENLVDLMSKANLFANDPEIGS